MDEFDRDMESDIVSWFVEKRNVVVAFSGGVDSAVVARAAVLASDRHGLVAPQALLAVSPTSTKSEPEEAVGLAAQIGIELHVLQTNELELPEFVRNDTRRCYFCKRLRFARMAEFARAFFGENRNERITLVEGSNADDLTDYRPGRKAVEELRFRSPLAELGITKHDVRKLARLWSLSVWDKPSNPCLATRIAYGLEINDDRLRQIELAEQFLFAKGFSSLRVRIDTPFSARIEIPADKINRFMAQEIKSETSAYLHSLGFAHVSLDLDGFRSGSMNVAVNDQISSS